MKQIMLSDEIYDELAALATQKGQTPEAVIAAWVQKQPWVDHAHEALTTYESWSATHEPAYLTESEFFAELDAVPLVGTSDANL